MNSLSFLLFGDLHEFREHRLPFLQSLPAYGDIVPVRLGREHIYTLHHPDLIHEVLVEQAEHFQKLRLTRNLFRRALNSDALLRKTQAWKQRREVVQDALHAKKVEAHAQTIIQLTQLAIPTWTDEINIYHQMRELTLKAVARTLFGTDVNIDVETAMAATNVLQEHGSRRFNTLFSPPLWIPTPNNVRVKGAVQALDGVIETMIEHVMLFNQDNLIKMLLNIQDKNEQSSRKDLREELVSLLMSGHETTATALAWVWLMLAQHPPVEAQVHEELQQILAGRPVSLADLPHLRYTEAVVKETLRLYPPSWVISRRTVQDIILGNTPIPEGATVFISPYSLHRDARWFDTPDQFRPERFMGETPPLRCTYLPFSTGPRKCIGSAFAMLEIMLILVTVLQACTLKRTEQTEIIPEALITLRPRTPILMRVTPR